MQLLVTINMSSSTYVSHCLFWKTSIRSLLLLFFGNNVSFSSARAEVSLSVAAASVLGKASAS